MSISPACTGNTVVMPMGKKLLRQGIAAVPDDTSLHTGLNVFQLFLVLFLLYAEHRQVSGRLVRGRHVSLAENSKAVPGPAVTCYASYCDGCR